MWSKFKAFVDDKINASEKFMLERVENIVEKRGNAAYQYFLLFPQCFLKAPFFKVIPFPTIFSKGFIHKVVKSRDCVVKS